MEGFAAHCEYDALPKTAAAILPVKVHQKRLSEQRDFLRALGMQLHFLVGGAAPRGSKARSWSCGHHT